MFSRSRKYEDLLHRVKVLEIKEQNRRYEAKLQRIPLCCKFGLVEPDMSSGYPKLDIDSVEKLLHKLTAKKVE